MGRGHQQDKGVDVIEGGGAESGGLHRGQFNRESGIGNRESGIGNRESGIGNRESGIALRCQIGHFPCIERYRP
ncbi:hypothetical protein BVV20_07280 [Xanthomonas oryzae pv. oryzae]|nr:hypothetical protein BVV20_07280 [Xanthomonas oryzae pv. oryzae]